MVKEEKQKVEHRLPPRIEPVIKEVETSTRVEKEKQTQMFAMPADAALPPLKLLDDPKPSSQGYSREALEAMSRLLEIKLKDFGVSGGSCRCASGTGNYPFSNWNLRLG